MTRDNKETRNKLKVRQLYYYVLYYLRYKEITKIKVTWFSFKRIYMFIGIVISSKSYTKCVCLFYFKYPYNEKKNPLQIVHIICLFDLASTNNFICELRGINVK